MCISSSSDLPFHSVSKSQSCLTVDTVFFQAPPEWSYFSPSFQECSDRSLSSTSRRSSRNQDSLANCTGTDLITQWNWWHNFKQCITPMYRDDKPAPMAIHCSICVQNVSVQICPPSWVSRIQNFDIWLSLWLDSVSSYKISDYPLNDEIWQKPMFSSMASIRYLAFTILYSIRRIFVIVLIYCSLQNNTKIRWHFSQMW